MKFFIRHNFLRPQLFRISKHVVDEVVTIWQQGGKCWEINQRIQYGPLCIFVRSVILNREL